MDNRTVGIRIIEGSDSATRVEKRDGGADCNPYLLLAADIAAGLDGIENKMEPSEITTGDGYADSEAGAIPTSLSEAIELAQKSEWLKNVLGDQLWELVIQQSERELDFFNNQVTPMETERYQGNF